MDQSIIYSKTGKGVLEIKNKAGKLSRDLAKVLTLVDGKSAVEDLISKSKLADADVARCLKQLEEGGYIKEFSSLSGAMSSTSSVGSASYVDDLDFTSQLSPGKRIYSNSASEMRARESADRERAEAEARSKREQAEQAKKDQAAAQAREEAVRLARIEAERKAKEAAALKARQQAELKAKQQEAEMAQTTRDLARILEAERQALEKSARQKKIEQDRKAQETAEIKAREQEEQKRKAEEERKRREEEERKRKEEEERKKRWLEEQERKRKEEEERKRKEEEERRQREEEERKRKEAEERKRREEEERKRREEEERKRREEEERKRREEEERKRKEEEERRRREEEERKRREEEERRRQEEEAERRRQEEEERKRKEEEERKRREEEEARLRREEEERKRREEEDRRRQEEDRRREEEDRRREEEDRRRREKEDLERRAREDEERSLREREEEEERQRRDEEDRLRREEEEARWAQDEEREQRAEENRSRDADDLPKFDLGSFDLPSAPADAGAPVASNSDAGEFDLPSVGNAGEVSFDSALGKGPDLSAIEKESFTANFDREQELRRKQEEEEERRRQEAEEARVAMERAQREEEAAAEAERRAAMEAEMRARVEQEKAERAERERQKREEYERKIEHEEERKRIEAQRREREEIQRKEADRKTREEDLVRRRQQQEEADRRRAEVKALQKRGKIRSPLERARPLIIGVIAVVALAVGVIHVVPMSGYIPAMEKRASEHIGEPVTIGSLKVSMVSGLQFKLANVSIGSTQDVSLSEVTITPQLGSLFGDKLVFQSIESSGGAIVKEVLLRLPSWQTRAASDSRLRVRSIRLRGVKFETRSFQLPAINADVYFSEDGSVTDAKVGTADGRLSADISRRGGGTEVSIAANNWTPPVGAELQFADFLGKGTVSGSTLTLSEWNATVYGGQVNGKGSITWGSRWSLSSSFEFSRVDAEELIAALSKTAKVSGRASGKGSLTAQAGSLDGLLDSPSFSADFRVERGTLDGVDLVSALQAGQSGTQGGATKFEELTGSVSISNERYNYSNVVLGAGILSARSNFSISGNQDVSGRVGIALRSPAQRLSVDLNITGTLRGISLRP